MSRISSDLLRLLAISAVLIIHSTSVQEAGLLHGTGSLFWNWLGVAMNQWARFSVPVFLILSGYGLTLKYANYAEPELSSDFFKRRFHKIGIPFLFWTFVFLVITGKLHYLTGGLPLSEKAHLFGQTLFRHLLISGADYHFYFLIIILECYLFFPFLFRHLGKGLYIFLALVHLSYQSPMHLLFQYYNVARPAFPSSFFIYWIFYFATGILFARHQNRITPILRQRQFLVGVTAIISFALVMIDYVSWNEHYRLRGGGDPGYYDHFTRISVTLYALSVMALFASFDAKIKTWLEKNSLNVFVSRGAALSFHVYIVHTILLRGLKLTPLAENPVTLSLFLIGLTFLWANLLEKKLKHPRVRTLLGFG